MNAIQELRQRLVQRFPTLSANFDEVSNDGGAWFLDLNVKPGESSTWMSVSWRPNDVFCVVQPTLDDPVEKPYQYQKDPEESYARLVELILECEAYRVSKGLAVTARQEG